MLILRLGFKAQTERSSPASMLNASFSIHHSPLLLLFCLSVGFPKLWRSFFAPLVEKTKWGWQQDTSEHSWNWISCVFHKKTSWIISWAQVIKKTSSLLATIHQETRFNHHSSKKSLAVFKVYQFHCCFEYWAESLPSYSQAMCSRFCCGRNLLLPCRLCS